MPRYDDDFYGWKRYVPAKARRAQAQREVAKLQKKGQTISPVEIMGRKIANTFWGKAWCDNLEAYSDFENRLPRGRTYVRNGSVVHLEIDTGEVKALVSGSSVYKVAVKVAGVPKKRWSAICDDCSGAIDSLVELLQGRFSKNVMDRICRQETGLFPSPAELEFSCSCPDWASMCKHVAAVFYAIGARLDQQPELLFKLRKVNEQDLIAKAGAGMPLSRKSPAAHKVLAEEDLSDVFGLDIANIADEPPDALAERDAGTKAAKATKGAPKRARVKKPAKQPEDPRTGRKASKKQAPLGGPGVTG